MITHDYYDHKDADRDINIVFPTDRLREFQNEKVIGELAETNYSFMGHIDGRHIPELINKSAVEVAQRLRSDQVDCVLFTPG
jgi:D-proline reductase (dithiol) PrdB